MKKQVIQVIQPCTKWITCFVREIRSSDPNRAYGSVDHLFYTNSLLEEIGVKQGYSSETDVWETTDPVIQVS